MILGFLNYRHMYIQGKGFPGGWNGKKKKKKKKTTPNTKKKKKKKNHSHISLFLKEN